LSEQWTQWKAVKDYRQREWNDKLQKLLAPYQKEFQVALHDGRLGSKGQRSGQLTEEEIAEGAQWWDVPWEAIPSTFWSACEIDWEKCQAKDETAKYGSILVETNDLFRVFPLPAPTPIGVGKIGEYFVVSDDVAIIRPGRPPKYKWEALFLEITRRVKEGSLPEKQDAFIKDMEEWCKENWVSCPGYTSLKMKIMPYYHAFVRPKKVRKSVIAPSRNF
jgi:hypothetical protein